MMTEEKSEFQLRYQYDARFGTLQFELSLPNEPVKAFQVLVADVLRMIPAYEMRVYMEQAAEDIKPYPAIDDLRYEAFVGLDLKGKTVLDVGGYMGEFSKVCLNQGAARAIVLDTEQWRHYGWEDKRLEGVEYVKGDLMDLAPGVGYWGFSAPEEEGLSRFTEVLRPDVLILYNILYHVKNPWAYLERAREIIAPDGVMLLCTLIRHHEGSWVYYYDPRECNPTDESVFWGPSVVALERWLRDTGWEFEKVGLAYDRVVYRCRATGEIAYRESRS